MRITEHEYDAFVEDHFPNMTAIRTWSQCTIWSAGIEQCLLILVDRGTHRAAVFDYDNPAERDADIRLVLNIPEDGGAGAPVPAVHRPTPPTRSAENALPIPPDQEE